MAVRGMARFFDLAMDDLWKRWPMPMQAIATIERLRTAGREALMVMAEEDREERLRCIGEW